MDGEMALLKEGGDEGVADEEEKCDEDVELGWDGLLFQHCGW